jgi:single-strand DNA-binding protein
MRSINKVILIGNATRDAELRQTQSGKAVSNIRLATNRVVGAGTDGGREEAQFHTVVCFDRLAEITGKYVTKGRLLYVEGRLAYRTFTDEEGKDRGVVEIIANDVQFLGGQGGARGAEEVAATATATTETVDLDDIPF